MEKKFILDYEALGEKIQQRRLSLQMSQEEAAEKSNLSTGYYGNVERGSRKLSLETLIKISNALSLDLTNLFLDSADIEDNETLQTELKNIFAGKTSSQVDYLINLLKLMSENIDKLQPK